PDLLYGGYLLSLGQPSFEEVGKFTVGCEKSSAQVYLSATALDADPPKLLRTVTFAGYVGQGSDALTRPPPLFFSVPIRASVAVTYARSVAAGSVPVASTRKTPFDR